MKYLITVFIFSIVLFLYLHIQYHLKTSGDLEIYTIEQPSKEKLEEICDLRQPVIVDYMIDNIRENCNLSALDDNYGAFDIQLRNVKNVETDVEMHLPFLFKEAIKLFQTDTEKKYITENNSDFMQETGVIKHYKYNDLFLRPPMVSKCIYDMWSGSIGACTPLRYHLNYRNYFYVTRGRIKMKLIPPHYSRYLDIQTDYENGEYRSFMNPWDIQTEHKAEFNKVKVLDLELTTGMLIYIPAYWNYSICYEEISSVSVFQYRTYMNTIAILPTLVIGLLQKHNIKRKNVKKVDILPSKNPIGETIIEKNVENIKLK